MGYHQGAARQERLLVYVSLDPDVIGLWAEFGWVDLWTYGYDQIDRQASQALEQSVKEVAGLDVKHSSQGDVDGGPVRQV